jgi:aldehyde dehydrogenase
MSPTSSAQVRQPDGQSTIHESGTFAAHLKTIEKKIPLRSRYENFIGGKWVAPAKGGYFENISPTTGQVICKIARSQAEDVEKAIDAAHAAADKWGRTAVAERARNLNKKADSMEE